MTDPAPRAPLDLELLTDIAAHFEKEGRESLECAQRIEHRMVIGCDFDGDRQTAAHYRRNAEHFTSRGRAIRDALAALASLSASQEPDK